ncbi:MULTISPECIES: hypothetical protein [Staphylococcus]|uniref:epilancin biosynthesis-related protein ElxI1 n=1 Tax=Staphylococcus TaxID=1279 RepID=UPI00069EDC33|nr:MULTISPECIES: hypothetical protein [Staphylococcus]MCH4383012.1 hypothetical protein [Staphylococcus haemolyticus]MCH4533521.1 hypothetical protein [Staphylococcus haemolyticus]OFP04564.1 hypothetical protein HMPREF3003_11820 [Staphylococcus sp. HMSC078B01]
MKILTKILDVLVGICVVLLFSKYAVSFMNMMFDWNLRWYFLENVPHLAFILFILLFVFAVPSEMIKDKQKESE